MTESSSFLRGERNGAYFLESASDFRCPRDGTLRSLYLTDTALEYSDSEGTAVSVQLYDVVGAKASEASAWGNGDERDEVRKEYTLLVSLYVGGEHGSSKCARSLCRPKRKAMRLSWLTSDGNLARKWANAMNDILRDSRSHQSSGQTSKIGPGRRLLVLVNPTSGRGQGLMAWEKILRPVLEDALIDITPVISRHAGHLTEALRQARPIVDEMMSTEADVFKETSRREESSGRTGQTERRDEHVGASSYLDLDGYDGIVAVGGDGTFFEVLQGLYSRSDHERQLERLSLGIVPAGSGNGLAKTLSEESGEEYGAMSASFLAAKGSTRKMDLVKTQSGSKEFLGFLNVGWGMVSDVDIESEAYRWMGSFRFTLGTIVRISFMRHYKGRLSFLPASCTDESPAEEEYGPLELPSVNESIAEMNGPRHGHHGWETLEGDFILVDVAQEKYVSHDMPMAPASRLGDGLLDLFFVRKGTSRMSIIKMFLAMERGDHVSINHPCLQWHRVRAFRIEPLTFRGRLTVDGELMDYVPLQQAVWPGAANVMCA